MATITLRSVKGSPLTNTEVDNNFNNLNTDKYESGSNPTFGNLTLTGDLKPSIAATVSAAGTNQSGATELADVYNIVTTVGSGAGVKLPTAGASLTYTVVNTTATNLLVYPNVSDKINGGTANAAVTVAAGSSATFIAKDATDWYSLTPLLVFDSSGTRLN
jgi:hypothetical protein